MINKEVLNNEKKEALTADNTAEQSMTKFLAIVLVGVLAVLSLSYGAVALFLSNKFYIGTVINNINCSGKTVEQAQGLISQKADNYILTIEERNDKAETLTSNEIDIKIDINNSLNKLLNEQKPYKWGLYLFKDNTKNADFTVSYNEEKLNEKLNSLECLNPELMTAPVNANVAYSEDSSRFEIIEENNGTTVKVDEAKSAIINSIQGLNETLSLEDAGVYTNAEIKSDNENLKKSQDVMNQYALVTITYNFGDKTEIVNHEKIKDWLIIDENGDATFDKDKVDEFVKYLAKTYNTFGNTREFKTSYGSVVTVVGGDYGWWLNQAEESDTLIAAIKEGNDIVKEPVYLQKAANYTENDIGNTYAEVNLSTQHMFFYKDGQKVFESDFVSGKPSTNHATPVGTYSVTYIQRDATLRGPGYATPVKYWMPFNLDVGFHDASWQSAFGGSRYLTHGSHGCINLPPSAAEKLFSYIAKGDAVVVYK